MADAVIVSTARTPLCKSWRGALNATHGATMGGHAVKAASEDLSRFHGTNERMASANLVDLIRFYHRLVQQSAGQ